MPQAHNIGPLFVQVTKFPYEWGSKLFVRGWTQEIEEPFRTATPLVVRLPNYKALVLGRWTGAKEEEEALNSALERRDVTYDDFTEKAGWTPAPDSDRETGVDYFHSRLNNVDGAVDVHNRQTYNDVAEVPERG
jgi:hypothetical protein